MSSSTKSGLRWTGLVVVVGVLIFGALGHDLNPFNDAKSQSVLVCEPSQPSHCWQVKIPSWPEQNAAKDEAVACMSCQDEGPDFPTPADDCCDNPVVDPNPSGELSLLTMEYMVTSGYMFIGDVVGQGPDQSPPQPTMLPEPTRVMPSPTALPQGFDDANSTPFS